MGGVTARSHGSGGAPVSALGMGYWTIGGPHSRQDNPGGWGAVNDQESKRVPGSAYQLFVKAFDTADVYDCGRTERLIAEALCDVRGEIVVATEEFVSIPGFKSVPQVEQNAGAIEHGALADQQMRQIADILRS